MGGAAAGVRPWESLAILARFPEPGRAKTRLIPALGPEGAAALHEALVRRTLAVVAELGAHRAVDARVWVCGAAPARFAAHFDCRLPCEAQREGDLGDRMRSAIDQMLERSGAALLIGADCPDLSAVGLALAFEALRRADVVIGPAQDGGYYLIGMKRPWPALFEGVAWSSPTVLAETLERAASLGLAAKLLPTLRDVDEPADLEAWREAVAATPPAAGAPALSVVLPTLNEAARIGSALESIRAPGVEAIVVDGGSDDQTTALAARLGARVVRGGRGRGEQLNTGAALARGGHLLFLHADTAPPPGFETLVANALADRRTAVGAFRFALARRGALLRCVELAVHLRCSAFALPYGDQGLFMRRGTFIALGGFAALPLMEDLDLVRRARRLGRVRVLPAKAITSARRWRRAGVLRMTAINQACVLGHLLGVPAERLAPWRSRWSREPARGAGRP